MQADRFDTTLVLLFFACFFAGATFSAIALTLINNFGKQAEEEEDTNEEEEEEDNENESLGDRMKKYETESEGITKVYPYEDMTVRLDGKNFSRQTHGLNKPFDELFATAMRLTARDMFVEFHPRTVYVQSDEITLVFPAFGTYEEFENKTCKSEHQFGGRVPKIISNMSGYASTRFTCHMFNLLQKSVKVNDLTLLRVEENGSADSKDENKHVKYFNNLYDNVSGLNATYNFDCRISVYPEGKSYEVVNNILWRSRFDGFRNFVSMLGYSVFSKKELDGKTTNERVEMLKTKGVDIETYPSHYKYGWLIKNKQVKEMRKDRDGKEVEVLRNRPTSVSFALKFSQEFTSFVLGKHLPAENDVIKYTEQI